ncbi:MAG: hypothetical protein ABI442_20270 [Gemmatimonadaceae bacterium]
MAKSGISIEFANPSTVVDDADRNQTAAEVLLELDFGGVGIDSIPNEFRETRDRADPNKAFEMVLLANGVDGSHIVPTAVGGSRIYFDNMAPVRCESSSFAARTTLAIAV